MGEGSNRIIRFDRMEKSKIEMDCVGLLEADADFLRSLRESREDVCAVLHESTLVGYCQSTSGESAYIYVYLLPEHRGKGYGKEAVLAAERMLVEKGAQSIVTSCRNDDARVDGVLRMLGYAKKFASHQMEYAGGLLPVASVHPPVRAYRDEDFAKAQQLHAQAFHQMRLSTGWFPDSVPEAPSDPMRKSWADTSHERYVYLADGEIVGFAHIEGNEIDSVSISTASQGKGYGRDFVSRICNRILSEGFDKVSLYCVVNNGKAHAFYQSLGFFEVSCNGYYYKPL